MKVNVSKFERELRAAGIPLEGVDSDGTVWYTNEVTEAQRETAAAILRDHNPLTPHPDDVVLAQTVQALQTALQSAENMIGMLPYYDMLQREQRKAVVHRKDIVTHYQDFLNQVNQEPKGYADFLHTLYLCTGLREDDLTPELPVEKMHEVIFVGMLYTGFGAFSAIVPAFLIMLKNRS
jgi:hypothetical protein